MIIALNGYQKKYYFQKDDNKVVSLFSKVTESFQKLMMDENKKCVISNFILDVVFRQMILSCYAGQYY